MGNSLRGTVDCDRSRYELRSGARCELRAERTASVQLVGMITSQLSMYDRHVDEFKRCVYAQQTLCNLLWFANGAARLAGMQIDRPYPQTRPQHMLQSEQAARAWRTAARQHLLSWNAQRVSFGDPLHRFTYVPLSLGSRFCSAVALDSIERMLTERLDTVSAGLQSSACKNVQSTPKNACREATNMVAVDLPATTGRCVRCCRCGGGLAPCQQT